MSVSFLAEKVVRLREETVKTALGVATACLVAASCVFRPSFAEGAEIKLLCAVAMKPALDEIAPGFERSTNHKLIITYATAGIVGAGGRDDKNDRAVPGPVQVLFDGAVLRWPCANRDRRSSCRSSHVRNAPKATAARQNLARRYVPARDMDTLLPRPSETPESGHRYQRAAWCALTA